MHETSTRTDATHSVLKRFRELYNRTTPRKHHPARLAIFLRDSQRAITRTWLRHAAIEPKDQPRSSPNRRTQKMRQYPLTEGMPSPSEACANTAVARNSSSHAAYEVDGFEHLASCLGRTSSRNRSKCCGGKPTEDNPKTGTSSATRRRRAAKGLARTGWTSMTVGRGLLQHLGCSAGLFGCRATHDIITSCRS